jgi:hypothetical protein
MMDAPFLHGGVDDSGEADEDSPMIIAPAYMCSPSTRIFLVAAAKARGGRGSA